MTSPARRHKQTLMAKQIAESSAVDDVKASQYELFLDQLAQHKRNLKQIKSRDKKIAFKQTILPEWQGYIDGVLEADTGKSDSIIGQLMIWSIDASLFDQAIRIATYMLKYDIALPEQFERDTVDAFVEEMAESWIKAEEPIITKEQLLTVEGLIGDFEIYDEVRAKLNRALGEAHADDAVTAVNYLETAIKLNPSVGCKPLFNKLSKELDEAKQTSAPKK